MDLSLLISSQRFKTAALLAGLFSTLYIVMNLFVIGGSDFIISFNNYLTVVLVIITLYFSFRLWQKVGTAPKSHALWRHMIAGWVLWAIAEILWAIFSALTQDVPYPSWADLFWLVGYIPMGLGLFARARSLPIKLSSRQQLAVWGISAATVLFGVVFVIFPILENNDPERLLESVLNIIFPLADLFLLMIVLYLFFAYERGAYGLAWRLLLAGFLVHQASNLLFSFASSADLYYPDQQANLLSTLGVDATYNLSYVFWMLGIYLLSLIFGEHQPFQLDASPKLVPNTHLLIFTKKDGTIIDISHNFPRWFSAEDIKGKTLSEILGLSRNEEIVSSENIRVIKKIIDRPIQIKLMSGEFQRPAWLCGMAIFTASGEYSGANFLVRIYSPEGTLDDRLTESEASVLRFLLNQNISNEANQVRQLLLDYYLAQIKLLYNMTFIEGGATLSQALLDALQTVVQKHGWQMQFTPQTIIDGTKYPVELLQNALPVMLETSKKFVAEVTETKEVEDQLHTLNLQFGAEVHQNIAQYMGQ